MERNPTVMEMLTEAENALHRAETVTDDAEALNQAIIGMGWILDLVTELVNRTPEVQAINRAADSQTTKDSL